MTDLDLRPRATGTTWRRLVSLRAVVVAVAAVVLFAAGLGLGMALQDRPVPGGEQTIVRTLEPLPQVAP